MDLDLELRRIFQPLLSRSKFFSDRIASIQILVEEAEPQTTRYTLDFLRRKFQRGEGAALPELTIEVKRSTLVHVIEKGYTDWTNSLLLSLRWRGRREGQFNPLIQRFFAALDVDKFDYVEAVLLREPTSGADEMIDIDDCEVSRYCPHMGADLLVFGSVESGVLTCAMHGWRFDSISGRCLTNDSWPGLRTGHNCASRLEEREG